MTCAKKIIYVRKGKWIGSREENWTSRCHVALNGRDESRGMGRRKGRSGEKYERKRIIRAVEDKDKKGGKKKEGKGKNGTRDEGQRV